MAFNNNDFKLRWKDEEGKDRSKVYSDYNAAQKAYKWLITNNAKDVDLAIIKRIEKQNDESQMFPSKSNEEN